MKFKRGISLIVLVITIIVIIILAGSIILSLSNNNPINSAAEATFKASANEYNSELALSISAKYVQSFNFDPTTINVTTWDGGATVIGTVKEYISSITVEDGKNYIINGGKLAYIGLDSSKIQWAKEMILKPLYVKSGLVVLLNGSNFTNSPQTPSWIDTSGNNNNAISSGFSYTTSSGSDGNSAIALDGIDDYLSINSLGLNGTNCSLSMFVYITNTSNQVLFASDSGIGLGLFNANYVILRAGDVSKSKRVAFNTGININQWNHIVINYDSTGNPSAYFNGREATYSTDQNYWVHQVSQAYIGCRNYATNSYFFNGKIKNVYLYNRVLTDSEIKQNYNASL
jgi:hypothetical protein